MFRIQAPGWGAVFNPLFKSEPYLALAARVKAAYETSMVFPEQDRLFAALEATDLPEVKCVILGQDPYHTPGAANGLAFAVNANRPAPPSLQNLFKELKDDRGEWCHDRTLTSWASQGVLLLNTALTVEKGKAGSHGRLGWDLFVDDVIEVLLARERPLCFLLLGKKAQARLEGRWIPPEHGVIATAHPSPYSADAGFFGSKPFSRVNAFLESKGQAPIQWVDLSRNALLRPTERPQTYFDGFAV